MQAASRESERLELVTGADILPERRKAFKETGGIEAVYEDYVEMIEKEQPDLAAVCTTATGVQKPGRLAPSRDFRGDMHAEITTRLANAGVPMIYVEKAMACSMEAADGILEACHKSGTILNTGVLMRFDHRFQTVRDVIKGGAIGEPTHAIAFTRSNTLMHMHIHSIDMLSFLLGDPGVTAARGELLPRDLKIEDNRLEEDPNSNYHIQFANGVEAWAVSAGPRDFEIIGTEGSIRAMNSATGTVLRKPEERGRTDPSFFETLLPPPHGSHAHVDLPGGPGGRP